MKREGFQFEVMAAISMNMELRRGSVTKHLKRSVAFKQICMGCEVRIIMGVEVMRRAWPVNGS